MPVFKISRVLGELLVPGRAPAKNRVAILMYHAVIRRPLKVYDWCFLDATAFRQQLEVLKEHERVVPLSEAVDRLEDGHMDEPMVAITFDDGFQNNYEVAFPILRELGLPATVFLTTGLVDTDDTLWFCRLHGALMATARQELEWDGQRFCLAGPQDRAMASARLQAWLKELPQPRLLNEVYGISRALGQDPEQPLEAGSPFGMLNQQSIAEMSDSGLVEFGAHGVSHAILSRLSRDQCCTQIAQSLASVQELTGKPCRYFAYPNGRAADYNRESARILEEYGVRAALTAIDGWNTRATSLMELRRTGIGADMTQRRFETVLVGAVGSRSGGTDR